MKRLHAAACVVHFVSAVFVFLLQGRDQPLKWTQFNVTTVKEAAILETFVEAIRVDPVIIVGWNEALTCLSHGIACFLRVDDLNVGGYSRKSEYTRRWLEYAVTAGLLEVAVLIGLGETNILVVLIVLLNNAALQCLGWSLDVNHSSVLPMISGFVLLGSIVLILSAHVANQIGLEIEWAYLVTIFSLFYASFGVHQTLYLLVEKYRKRFDVDKIYVCLSLTSKIVLSWTFIAVYHRTLVRLDDPGHLNWDTEWQVIMYTLAGLGLLFIVFFYCKLAGVSEYAKVNGNPII